MDSLGPEAQRVAADFVAVYLAEQYRHLIAGQGQYLGKRHNWDDAHLQVSLIAAFHTGQDPDHRALFYKGNFQEQVYHQIDSNLCVYRLPVYEIPESYPKRSMNLTDYWQFNETCDRSGVNLTRRDFKKMGRAASQWLIRNSESLSVKSFNESLNRKWTSNFVEAIAEEIISNSAPRTWESPDELVTLFLQWIEELRNRAPEITERIRSKLN